MVSKYKIWTRVAAFILKIIKSINLISETHTCIENLHSSRHLDQSKHWTYNSGPWTPQQITLSTRGIFSQANNRHKRSAMAYFFAIFLHEQHKQYISFPFLQHIDLKTYQQLLARSGWQRWNVTFIHCLSASVRTKTSGRCMVVRSLQKWCTVKKKKKKKIQPFPHLIFW